MFYYKIKIQYAGTHYAGFQFLPDLKTVQGEINLALSKLTSKKVTTVGASRTDSGVHACDQIVKVSSEVAIENLVVNLNKHLPSDIQCLKSESCNGDFRPSSQAMSKEYRYFFTNKKQSLSQLYIANFSNPIDLEKMKACTQLIIGEHDFCNFYSMGSNVKSSVRTVLSCELSIVNPQQLLDQKIFPIGEEQCFQFAIEASGFLKQMIRHLISALWMVGSGKMSIEDFKNLLNASKHDKQLWKVAPPNGLFLYKIKY